VPALGGKLGAAGGLLVPPPDALRSSAPLLCRRCRNRTESEACDIYKAGRSRASDRRPHGRDALLRLHAAEEPLSRPDTGPCSPRPVGARPRLPADAGDRRLAGRVHGGLFRPWTESAAG